MRSRAVRLVGLWLIGSVTNLALFSLFAIAVVAAFTDIQEPVNVLLTAAVQVAAVAAVLVALVLRYTPRAGGPTHWFDQGLFGIGVVVLGHVGSWLVLPLLDGSTVGFWLAAVIGGLMFVLAAALFAVIGAIGQRWAG